MEISQIENNISKTISLLNSIFPDNKLIIGGSYGLYLNGTPLNREYHDFDVKVVGISVKELAKIKIDNEIPIHFLENLDIPLEYHTVVFKDKELLVYTTKSIIDCKKHCIEFNKIRKIKTDFSERIIKKNTEDIIYLKENYNIE